LKKEPKTGDRKEINISFNFKPWHTDLVSLAEIPVIQPGSHIVKSSREQIETYQTMNLHIHSGNEILNDPFLEIHTTMSK
jgi:hypothetical protein